MCVYFVRKPSVGNPMKKIFNNFLLSELYVVAFMGYFKDFLTPVSVHVNEMLYLSGILRVCHLYHEVIYMIFIQKIILIIVCLVQLWFDLFKGIYFNIIRY